MPLQEIPYKDTKQGKLLHGVTPAFFFWFGKDGRTHVFSPCYNENKHKATHYKHLEWARS